MHLENLGKQIVGDLNIAYFNEEAKRYVVYAVIRELVFKHLMTEYWERLGEFERDDFRNLLSKLGLREYPGMKADPHMESFYQEMVLYLRSRMEDYQTVFWQSYRSALITAQDMIRGYRHRV